MARIAAIVYSTNNLPYTELAIKFLRENSDPRLTEIVMVDNGSPIPFPELGDRNIRYDENIGGNAIFHRFKVDDWFVDDEVPEFLAFFHCDLWIREKGWDRRVLEAFDEHARLALLGFVGSDQIDGLGGRGLGTMLNFLGDSYEGIGKCTPAEVHGRRETGLQAAAVLDHCSMIFDTATLTHLTPQEGNYAPFHFYDRILCCEVLEQKLWISVLGISVDHTSAGIGPGTPQADILMRRWLDREGIPYAPDRPDIAMYVESERRFKERFDGFFPLRVHSDHRIIR